MGGFNLATALIIVLLLFQGDHLCIGQNKAFGGHFGLQRLKTIPEVDQIVVKLDAAYAAAGDEHSALPQLITRLDLAVGRKISAILANSGLR